MIDIDMVFRKKSEKKGKVTRKESSRITEGLCKWTEWFSAESANGQTPEHERNECGWEEDTDQWLRWYSAKPEATWRLLNTLI